MCFFKVRCYVVMMKCYVLFLNLIILLRFWHCFLVLHFLRNNPLCTFLMAILLHPFRLQLLPLLLFSPPFLANILQGIREVKDALFIEFLLLGDPTIFILVEIKKKRKKLQTHKCFSQKSVDNYLFHPSLNLLTFLEKFMVNTILK